MSNLKKMVVDTMAIAIKHKLVTEKKAREIIALPLVDIGETKLEREDNELTRYIDEHFLGSECNITFEDIPLLEASYWIKSFGLYVLKVVEFNEESMSCVIYVEYYVNSGNKNLKPAAIKGTVHIDTTRESNDYWVITDKNINQGGSSVYNPITPSLEAAFNGLLKNGFILLKHFMDFQNVNDLYPVSVEPKQRMSVSGGTGKIDKRLELDYVNSPKVKFLNVLPVDRSVSSGICNVEPEPLKVGFQKVGFWKTLSHERFSKHPKYQVHKGVYVKPAWVGPRTSDYQGHVYRVMLPSEHKQRIRHEQAPS